MTAARWSSLLAALGGILGGITTSGDDRLSAALFAVGFLMLGVWLTLLIRSSDAPDDLGGSIMEEEH